MAHTEPAAIVEASRILQAIALARIRGSPKAPLVGVSQIEKDGDHKTYQQREDEQGLLQDTCRY